MSVLRKGPVGLAVWAFLVAAVSLATAQAQTKIWNTTTGDWSVDGNWSGGLPVAGDAVVITNAGAYVLLSSSTPELSSLEIGNAATLTCSNWDTHISATNLTIRNGGVLTCVGPFTNNVMSNRVWVSCSNLLIETGGGIDVSGKGYAGGTNSAWAFGYGPGGVQSQFGASYGGAGAHPNNGALHWANIYGSPSAPLDPGSGGGSGISADPANVGGAGGGAVCITATQVVVNGSINADAGVYPEVGNYATGGSGGGIYITCSTITGNGSISARGADGKTYGGGGGGGRIAVQYGSAQNSISVPALSFLVTGGASPSQLLPYPPYAEPGTLYFPDTYFFSPTNLFSGQWIVPGFTNLSVDTLVVSNVWIRLPGAGFRLTVTNTLTVVSTTFASQYKLELTDGAILSCDKCQIIGGNLTLGYRDRSVSGYTNGPTMTCAHDLTLTNSGWFCVYGGLTDAGATAGYGAHVNVGGIMRIGNNCSLFPATHPTNGAAVLFSVGDLTLDSSGLINADYRGYWNGIGESSGTGPGVGVWDMGSGYGGQGGGGHWQGPTEVGGPTYGSSNAPVAPGSGAQGRPDDPVSLGGGGSVQIRASKTVTIQGTITANGSSGSGLSPQGGYEGGASGGGIYITCSTFIGDPAGIVRANGGDGWWNGSLGGGSGGGGRIAIWRVFDKSPGPGSIHTYVNAGTTCEAGKMAAEAGTIVWGWLPCSGTIITIR